MAMEIKDGKGRGYTQAVTKDNRAMVDGAVSSQEHEISHEEGRAFVANTADSADTLTLATGNTYNVIFLKNTSTSRSMIIQKIVCSADTAGIVMTFQKNMALGTVSANNVHIPTNGNFSSGNSAEVLCHNWDETGTAGIGGLTGGNKLETFILGSGILFHPIDGFMILGQGDSLTIRMTNGTGGDVEISAGIRFYADTSESR